VETCPHRRAVVREIFSRKKKEAEKQRKNDELAVN
jgi:hypothetical protein